MEKILKLYTYVDGVNDIAFPSESEQVIIPSFTYNAKRMGDAPIISFSFMHTQCLDDLWSDMVYAEFNGERYYIKQTPSSSFDNTDSRYKHSVEMVSERSVLSDVFLFDVVTKNQGEDKPASNNSNVVFFGDIHEFASRINLSLNYSRVEYRVDVPSNITSEAKLMSLNKQYITQALAEIYKTYGLFYQFDGKVIRVSKSENEIQDVFEYGSDKALISTSKNNANKKIITRCTGFGSSDNIPYYYPNPTPYGELNILYNGATTNNVVIFDWGRFAKCGITNTLKYGQVSVSGGDDKIYPLSKFEEYDVIDLTPITGESSYGWVGYCKFEINESYHDVVLEIKNNFGGGYANLEIKNNDGTPVWWGNEMPENGIRLSYGNYTAYVTFDVGSDDYEAETTARQYGEITLTLKRTPLIKEGWVLNGVVVELNNFGIRYAGDVEEGDVISFNQVNGSRIPVAPYLMPYIYRYTDGKEVFYHAQNNTYRDDKGEYYIFDNIYIEGRPREDIIELEDIKPTIEGVIYNGNRIDTFVDFEYDDDDSDEMDNNGNYVHPYFFAKLNRLNFNLFAHAIEGKPMTIAMTSGSCGACQWTIGVDDNTQANLVQVDENGNLLRDDNGNVRCGRAGTQREIAQSKQNDTINNEVWIALKKEYNTFGIIMPNKANNYKPGIGDTFVILNINLPHSYIVKAEQRLTEAIIKHMYDNNAEKFNFGIKFSRIYLQEHEDVLKNLNENSAINVKYNGRQFTLHASSYTYKITDNEALPEISLELSDEISISNGTILKAISKVETDVEKVGKKTLAEVQSISAKKANKSTTLEGYGITDAYTREEAVKEFIPTRTDAEVSGIKDFTDGFKVSGILIKYDALKDALIFPSNVIVNKGVAWNSRLEDFSDEEIFTITGAVQVDWKTIGKNENGELYVIGGTSGGGGGVVGGVTIDEVKNYLTAEKYTTETWVSSQNYATQSWVTDKGYITGITSPMVTSALGYTPLDSSNFTKSKIKSTLGISDWALASVKPSYKFSEITNKPTNLSGYGITDAYTKTETNSAIDNRINALVDGAPSAYDTLKEIADVLAGNVDSIGDILTSLGTKANKATTLAGYGIVDAYTKSQVDSALAKKWTQDDNLIANWSAAYSWGNHARAGYAKQSDVTEEFKKYVTLSTAQTITGIKNFSNGFKVGNVLVSYNASKNAFILPANVIVEGGIAWNSSLDGFDVPTIAQAVKVDGSTIGKMADGTLYVIDGTGGGIDEEQLANYLTNNNYAKKSDIPSLSGYATKSFVTSQGYITSAAIPTKLSQLEDDVVNVSIVKNFLNGLKIGGALVTYNAENNAFVFPANAIFEGGVAWNSKIDGFDIPTIMDAIQVDGSTISKANGYLEFIGKTGGGAADSVAWENVIGRPTKLSQFTNDSGFITSASLPTKLSQFTDDVVSGNYLPIKGIAEGAKTLKGLATSSSWIVAAGNGFNVYNNSSTKRCWFGFSLPEGSPYATTKWVFGASDSSYNAAGEIYAKHISLGYGDSTTTGGYALRANGDAKIDGSLTLNGKIISYNSSNNAFILPANVIIEGGVAWNSKLDGFDIPTIMDAVIVDGDTIVKENGVLKVNGDVSGGINETQLGNYLTRNNYAKKSDIPSLSGYATESFVTSRGYITASAIPTKVSAFTNDASYATESFVTSRGYITSAAISKANIKSILGISDWALAATSPLVNHGKITSTTDLATLATGIGYTQVYTPVEDAYDYGQILNFKTYRGHTQIYVASRCRSIHIRNEWNPTGIEERTWYEILSSNTYTKYAMSLTTDQRVTGIKNFVNGFKVGDNLITYDASLKSFVLNGNLIVKGGIAWEKQNS
jgi:hypothetical protein